MSIRIQITMLTFNVSPLSFEGLLHAPLFSFLTFCSLPGLGGVSRGVHRR